MKDKEIENNGACVIGRVLSGFSYSHETYGERFYRTDIIVPRSSGITDAVPLMVSGKLMDGGRDWQGGMVEAIGQFRSYNRKEDGESHLELSVFVQGIRFLDAGCPDYGSNNCVRLKGFLCKPPNGEKSQCNLSETQ